MPEDSGVALDAARETGRPPRDDLVRAARGGVALRALAPVVDNEAPSANANGMPTLFGHFARFNEWTEIESVFEGHFMERIAPGAFKKTFSEGAPKVLFQHGFDPQIADKPLGAPAVLREDAEGAYFEVPLLDTSYNRDLIPGLEAGLYGASFRFSVVREDFDRHPARSDSNPEGIPERTLKEIRVRESGPVTWPAYGNTQMGVRSMTDEYLTARMTTHPERLRMLLSYLEKRDERPPTSPASVPEEESAPPQDRAEESPHPVGERRETVSTRKGATPIYGMSRKETSTPWRL